MEKSEKQIIVTGIRPTGDLHIGNYLGAVKPLIDTLEIHPEAEVYIFVADLHGLTDNKPETIHAYRYEVVRDYLAFGLDKYIDSGRVHLFIQSQIGELVSYLAILLSRYTTFNDLMRVPTLKDKLKGNQEAGQATALLGLYPVLMASDILIHNATIVPIGHDQLPHLEKTRELAEKFNNEFGAIFNLPQAQNIANLRVLSMKGGSKMSKSYPEGAIFMSDNAETIRQKVSRAETALEGQMSVSLESLFTIAKELGLDTDQFRSDHMAGKQVAGEFKKQLAELIVILTDEFQKKRKDITDDQIANVIKEGGKKARASAEDMMNKIKRAMKINY
ncbi:MAG: tryptophan--tRNA ligase [bacterium]|nr:tryptophan--tRNA ligase [bacterium]